jgi:diacylglycerol kinase family enzyme
VCAVEVKAIEAVIIGNPNSGSAGEEGYLERFAETLRAGGLEIEVLNTERPDHATEHAAMAAIGSSLCRIGSLICFFYFPFYLCC